MHVLVALQIAVDLFLHAEGDTFQRPCHLGRVATLVERRRELREVI